MHESRMGSSRNSDSVFKQVSTGIGKSMRASGRNHPQ